MIRRRLNPIFFVSGSFLLSGFLTVRAIAVEAGGNTAELDPAAGGKVLSEKLGKDFVDSTKNDANMNDGGGDLNNLKDVWQSSPSFKDPQLDGVDVSNLFQLQEIAEPVGIYRYSAFGKPDPFMPPYDQYRQTRVAALEIPIVSPLQVALSTLRVTGMWQLENGTRRALILTNSGEGIIAGIGDPIGLSGKIIDIQDHGVITRQYRIRTDGSREFNDVTLAFGKIKTEESEKIVLEPGKDPTVAAPERPETSERILRPASEKLGPPAAVNGEVVPQIPLPAVKRTEGAAKTSAVQEPLREGVTR